MITKKTWLSCVILGIPMVSIALNGCGGGGGILPAQVEPNNTPVPTIAPVPASTTTPGATATPVPRATATPRPNPTATTAPIRPNTVVISGAAMGSNVDSAAFVPTVRSAIINFKIELTQPNAQGASRNVYIMFAGSPILGREYDVSVSPSPSGPSVIYSQGAFGEANSSTWVSHDSQGTFVLDSIDSSRAEFEGAKGTKYSFRLINVKMEAESSAEGSFILNFSGTATRP